MKKLIYAIAIMILLWMVVSTTEVWIHNREINYIYSRANIWAIMITTTKEMKVVKNEINKADDSFLVTVEDIYGNRYGYYDDEPKEIESIVEVTLQGDLIIDVN